MLNRELEHAYGDWVHFLQDSYMCTLLARLGHPETAMRDLRPLLRRIYERLLGAMLASEFPAKSERWPTRMADLDPCGHYEGPVLDQDTRVAIACIVRAGTLPAEICYDSLLQALPETNVRLDYLSMSRRTDAKGQVIGTDTSGSKIGGDISDGILLIPDPMGATGGTIARTLEIYEERGLGPWRRAIAMPMIATPEYVRRLHPYRDKLSIWAGRLDRGRSRPEVLAKLPGSDDSESGLNDKQYIVPGAGGVGELLSNSWV
ncbi:MAG: uracil phosphoribosyltransferase [Planctomycetota bacterium]|nr:MAG: uracil phosphoribosyltransferase [Planctomycetota bacterium]